VPENEFGTNDIELLPIRRKNYDKGNVNNDTVLTSIQLDTITDTITSEGTGNGSGTNSNMISWTSSHPTSTMSSGVGS